jgi:uncharacterized protein
MTLNRRQLIARGGAAGVGAAALGLGLSVDDAAAADPRASRKGGRLFPPLEASAGDLLALPPGFTYEVVAEAGVTEIHDGSGTIIGKTPDKTDGTGLFATSRG